MQNTAVFTLLLYKYVFYSFCSIDKIHHPVYRVIYRYFSRNSVFFIGILSVFKGNFGLGKIFETLVAALQQCSGQSTCDDSQKEPVASNPLDIEALNLGCQE